MINISTRHGWSMCDGVRGSADTVRFSFVRVTVAVSTRESASWCSGRPAVPVSSSWDPQYLQTCDYATLQDGNKACKGTETMATSPCSPLPSLAPASLMDGARNTLTYAVTGIALREVDRHRPSGITYRPRFRLPQRLSEKGPRHQGRVCSDTDAGCDAGLLVLDSVPKPELTFSGHRGRRGSRRGHQ